jgi:Fe-S-cluster containining protein
MFECNNCGACCRMPAVRAYGLPVRDDGSCMHLVDNKCSIYNDRPLVCRIDDGWKEFFSKSMTLEQWYAWNKEWCVKLQEQERVRGA